VSQAGRYAIAFPQTQGTAWRDLCRTAWKENKLALELCETASFRGTRGLGRPLFNPREHGLGRDACGLGQHAGEGDFSSCRFALTALKATDKKGHLYPRSRPAPRQAQEAPSHLAVLCGAGTAPANPQCWQKDFGSTGEGPGCPPAFPPGALTLHTQPQGLQAWLLTPGCAETGSRPRLTPLAALPRGQLPARSPGSVCRQPNKEDLFWRQLASQQMRLFSSDFMNSLWSSYVTRAH